MPSSRAARRDALLLAVLTPAFFGLAVTLELSEDVARFAGGHERWQLDELPLTLLVLSLGLAWFGWRRLRELRVAEAASSELSRRLITLQEEERRGIARELHDELGQYFSAIKVDAISIGRALGPASDADAPRRSAQAIVKAADHMHAIARGMLQRLRPAGLDELGLAACLQDLAETWEQRHGVECAFLPSGELGELPEAVAITAYRIVQECLSNVARHAGATRATVRLARGAGALVLSVEDDGRGLRAGAGMGLGLPGMRERAAALGGSLVVDASPTGGVRVGASLPLLGAASALASGAASGAAP